MEGRDFGTDAVERPSRRGMSRGRRMPPGTVTRHTLLTAHALALRAADTAVTAGRTTWRFVRRRPQRAGAIAAAVLVVAAAGYGLRRGEHSPIPQNFFADLGDTVANAAGFKIATLTVTGRAQLSEAELLAAGGITTNTSLLLLDVAAVRQKLESSPWIAHATVRKLYPNHLEIAIEERQAFALWQKNGQISLIAVDGTVLAPVEAGSAPRLPLVVGPGAAAKAHDFLGMLDRYPVLRDDMRAAILVADRRWNLRMKSGLDIRLPEEGVDAALDTLMALDREKKLLTRDLTAIDLRIPERVTVRLSDEAAQARENAIKEREKKKRKGGDA